MQTNLAVDLTKEVEEQTLAIPERSKALVISNKEDMERADLFKKEIKALIKEIDSCFKPMADKAFQAHREITGRWKTTKAPLEDADKLITQKAKAYIREEEKKREEEERRLREIARREEEERRLAEAAELEKEGNAEEAEAILNEPIEVAAPVVERAIPKIDNRMYRKTWKWRIVDEKKIPREYLCVDEKKINGVVRALKDATSIPGVEVYEE